MIVNANDKIIEVLHFLAPEFKDKSLEDLNRMIEIVKLQVSESVYRDSYPMAVALLTAHYFSIATSSPGEDDSAGGSSGGGVRGPLISEKEGDLMRTYARPESGSSGSSGSAVNLSTTNYGVMFLNLKRSYIFSPLYTGGGLFRGGLHDKSF